MSIDSNLRDSLKRLKILVIGDLILDHYVWGDATRISPEAPVPVVSVERDSWVPGGAANVAANLAGLGVQTSLLGTYGADPDGERLSGLLSAKGIELLDIGRQAGSWTIVKARVVVQRQQMCRLDRELQPNAYALADGWTSVLQQEWDAILVSDYAKGVVTANTLAELRQCRNGSGQTPLLALDPKPKRMLDWSGFDLMTPNHGEALQLAGLAEDSKDSASDPQLCERIYRRFAPKNLIVTLGPDGMLLCEKGTMLGRMPTVAREVFDVSGAGDTVIAVLTAALAAGLPLKSAADLANRAAGIVVGHIGTAPINFTELESD